jgi:hypothetical protein
LEKFSLTFQRAPRLQIHAENFAIQPSLYLSISAAYYYLLI